jgi:endo-1,3(4)-beta-glucanase
MVESNLPIDMGLAPWSPGGRSRAALSEAAKQTIRNVAPSELSQNVAEQTDLDSMYFSGKALNKFAGMVYTIHELVQDPSLASAAFQTLKDSFGRFVQNRQRFPLAYDNVWKGVVSTGTYQTGDPGLDFGNTLYNDHHFHYGYFILTAAIIGRLDPGWLTANKAWVNMLVRDSCNPSTDDPHFPFSRGFDWYHGHSWAKGIFESMDGKDEESTSEDTMFAYALKMWGKTIGDASMEARGNLMLAILARSLNNYFLMKKDNVNQPKNFIDNKVTGIVSVNFLPFRLFE